MYEAVSDCLGFNILNSTCYSFATFTNDVMADTIGLATLLLTRAKILVKSHLR